MIEVKYVGGKKSVIVILQPTKRELKVKHDEIFLVTEDELKYLPKTIIIVEKEQTEEQEV